MTVGKTILTWFALPLISSLTLTLLVLIFFFGYAGLAQNLVIAPVLSENKLNGNLRPTELSSANMKLINIYKETAKNTVPEKTIKDYYRQEAAYRVTWGLLAALDTVIYKLDNRQNPSGHARQLMTNKNSKPLFEYKDSQITIVTTTERRYQASNGKWQIDKKTGTEIKNIQLLTLARTFAGNFQHLYKRATTTTFSETGGTDTYTKTKVVTTKENLAGIDAHPSTMEQLRQILINNDLNDETDIDLVLGLADSYDVDKADSDGSARNFWQVALDKAGWTSEQQSPNTALVPWDSDSIGNLGSFQTWPTPASKEISSPFGMRLHPIKNIGLMHTGIDIAAPGGSPIVAAGPGKIIANRYSLSYGNLVIIDHGDGISSSYNHMQERSPLEIGSIVRTGELIGKVGSTGLSTGNHLHFEIRVSGQCRDPVAYAFGQ
jgi:murein DD-endopeptidase MepM/ murein hydrolase activator NlpD